MTESEKAAGGAVSEGAPSGNGETLPLKVEQLEAEVRALERETKALRQLLERAVEHRQKSHSELVLLLTGLVSKLPINEVGAIVSRLVEHNEQVGQFHSMVVKGGSDLVLPAPAVIQTLEQTKKSLRGTINPLVDELIQLDTPFE